MNWWVTNFNSLQSCRNPDNGVIGKCCRDPNYVDPWPMGNLPANYSGGFDEQGFPSYLNIAKTRPQKKTKVAPPPAKTFEPLKISQPVKASPPSQAKTFQLPQFSLPQNFPTLPPQIQNFGNQIQSIPSKIQSQLANLNPFRPQTPKPLVPDAPVQEVADSANKHEVFSTTQKPQNGLFGNPSNSGRNTYDSASSNQVPVSITPHRPGAQCGLRNTVSCLNG